MPELKRRWHLNQQRGKSEDQLKNRGLFALKNE
jgi:hypothetical protein